MAGNSTAADRDPRTHAVIGAAMEVHRVLGCGFLEAVYHSALAREFAIRDIPFVREMPLPISYKGVALECGYRVDFVAFEEVLVEIKAISKLSGLEDAQMLNYLKASPLNVGLLINFGATALDFKRLIHTR